MTERAFRNAITTGQSLDRYRRPGRELAARSRTGFVNEATGYLANFRQAVQPMSTGGVLVPPAR